MKKYYNFIVLFLIIAVHIELIFAGHIYVEDPQIKY